MRRAPREAHLILIAARVVSIIMSHHRTSLAVRSLATLSLVDNIQQACYGIWNQPNFPLPLPVNEAGPCVNGQRRYLWTDAFGICNYLSQYLLINTLSDHFSREEIHSQQQTYLQSAKRLIESVNTSLGQPRSEEYPMKRKEEHYVGLRIGKVLASHSSDMGMKYDGNET